MELIIGTRKWSSWSLRPWLVMKHLGLDFTETLVTLRQAEGVTRQEILVHSPSGQVPALKVDGMVVTDSLAICLYLAHTYPQARLLPDDKVLRALGLSAMAEMHAGFMDLRRDCAMYLEIEPRKAELSEAVEANVRRIVDIWLDLLTRSSGPYLLGSWSLVDAFYTPVATRIRTWQIDLAQYGDDGRAAQYAERLLADPHFLEWEAEAKREV